jgi:phosphoribosylformylglycinamidine cyclo-ligase
VVEAKLAWDAPAPFAAASTLGAALLAPTRIYVRSVLAAIRATGSAVKGIAHITGGGLSENLPRVLPQGLAAHVDLGAWRMPAVLAWLQHVSHLDDAAMLRTFNCGIGLVVIAERAEAETVASVLAVGGEMPVRLGEIEPGRGAKSRGKGKGEVEAVRYSGRLAAP